MNIYFWLFDILKRMLHDVKKSEVNVYWTVHIDWTKIIRLTLWRRVIVTTNCYFMIHGSLPVLWDQSFEIPLFFFRIARYYITNVSSLLVLWLSTIIYTKVILIITRLQMVNMDLFNIKRLKIFFQEERVNYKSVIHEQKN